MLCLPPLRVPVAPPPEMKNRGLTACKPLAYLLYTQFHFVLLLKIRYGQNIVSNGQGWIYIFTLYILRLQYQHGKPHRWRNSVL